MRLNRNSIDTPEENGSSFARSVDAIPNVAPGANPDATPNVQIVIYENVALAKLVS